MIKSRAIMLDETFREVTLTKALALAADPSRKYSRCETRHSQMLVAIFSDGLEIAWQSEGGQPISDVTPDPQWQPPTVWARVNPPHPAR
jgi:hypothetical protein